MKHSAMLVTLNPAQASVKLLLFTTMELIKYRTFLLLIPILFVIQLCALWMLRHGETPNMASRIHLEFTETLVSRQNRSVIRQRISLTTQRNDEFINITSHQQCYKSGTNIKLSSQNCVCLHGYFGDDCGIPAPVWFSFYNNSQNHLDYPLIPRRFQRRVIHGLNINHEVDLLYIRLKELEDLVDAYIICESNYTAHGDPKKLTVLAALGLGQFESYLHKISYVIMNFFPEKSKTDGWYADTFLRQFMGQEGLPLITNQEDDDLFLMFDADEIPSAEVIKFLRMYHGYPETVTFVLRWSVFNFYWQRKRTDQPGIEEVDTTHIPACTTIGMLRDVYGYDFMSLRRPEWSQGFFTRYMAYKNKGRVVGDFAVGSLAFPAGWHCSWCFSPEGILQKMVSAHSLDSPRWGDFPEKLNVSYIESLVLNGEWFDGTKPFVPSDTKDMYYAPRYVIGNYLRYLDMLYP